MPDLAFERYDPPTPPAYGRRLANALERREPELWRLLSAPGPVAQALDAIRLRLEQRAARIRRDDQVEVYAAAEEIAARMGAADEVRLWTSEGAARRNAAVYFDPTVVHIAFENDALDVLDPAEIRFALGHEIAHHKLWTIDDGRNWTATRLLSHAVSQPHCPPAFHETARLNRLYAELHADRAGLWAVGDLDPALRAIAKLTLGVEQPSGSAVLADAEAALADLLARRDAEGGAGVGGPSHPTADIRIALLAAWAHGPAQADATASALLESAQPLEALDLLGQERLADLTHWMLAEFLGDVWRNRELVLAHAAEYSPALADDLRAGSASDGEGADLGPLRQAISAANSSVRRYLAYVLLDFSTVDPRLDTAMLASALRFAADFDLADPFRKAAVAELKTTRSKLAELEKDADQIIARAALALGEEKDGVAESATAVGGGS